MSETKKISVIIPVYNERATLPLILERVQKQKPAEIIIVDDASSDGSEEYLKNYKAENVKIIRHEKNFGKGAAVRTGFQAASNEVVLIQDADLEYDPSEYERLLKPIFEGRADVVYGSRFVGNEPHRVSYFWHYIGNRFLTTLVNLFTNLNLTDMESGYKAFRKTALDSIKLVENDFSIEPEFTIKLARKGYRFYEVGISYHGRTYAEGKKIRWTDGVKAVYAIFKHALLS